MSLDVELYAVAPVSLRELWADLPGSDAWSDYGQDLAYHGDGWQVLVGEAEEIAAGDVPSDVRSVLQDVRYMIPLTLEPSGAPEEGQRFFERVFEAVASATGAAGRDFRTGTARRFGD